MVYCHTDDINGYVKESHVLVINTNGLKNERPAAMDSAVAEMPN